MSEQNTASATKQFLDSLYKNVKMGADSIIDLMPKVKDDGLRAEMTAELEKYESFAKEIREILFDNDEEPKPESIMSKMGVKMGVMMNTMMDDTTSHIADMMIQGATMGITNTTKLIREYENTTCSESALALARKTVQYEEESIERLKKFL
ncbi:MAG: hypothetical protein E7642_00835 [Ruminococcaceae bacterium]|nr:hypothetical protein [Oscillospiraceae bacterium]